MKICFCCRLIGVAVKVCHTVFLIYLTFIILQNATFWPARKIVQLLNDLKAFSTSEPYCCVVLKHKLTKQNFSTFKQFLLYVKVT